MKAKRSSPPLLRGVIYACSCTLLLACTMLIAPFAMAQSHVPGPSSCLDVLTSRTNVCTANDVRIALILNEGGDLYCKEGDTVNVDLIAHTVANSQDRWDIGYVINTNGMSAKTDTTAGGCYIDYLYPASTCPESSYDPGLASGYDADGNAIPPITAGTVFHNDECDVDPNDTCADLKQGVNNFYAFQNTLEIPCVDNDNDGKVDISSCVSWDNQQSAGTANKPSCNDTGDALPSTKSKCRCETQNIGNVYTAGNIIVRKTTVPAGNSTQQFNFTLSGPTQPASGLTLPHNFSLYGSSADFDSGGLKPSSIPPTGTYSVVENGTYPGWEKTSVVCTSSEGGTETPTAIDLTSGETVTCVFTNTEICPSTLDCSAGDTVCAAAACDPAGEPNNCDAWNYFSATTTCRTGSGDSCDPDESCTGSSELCPDDVVASATTTFRSSPAPAWPAKPARQTWLLRPPPPAVPARAIPAIRMSPAPAWPAKPARQTWLLRPPPPAVLVRMRVTRTTPAPVFRANPARPTRPSTVPRKVAARVTGRTTRRLGMVTRLMRRLTSR